MANEYVKKVQNQVAETIANLMETADPNDWGRHWATTMPASVNTGKPYRGTNSLYLWAIQQLRGYSSNYWVTYNQLKKRGWRTSREELKRPTAIVFASRKVVTDDNGEVVKSFPFFKVYNVYNLDQIQEHDFVPESGKREDDETNQKADDVIRHYLEKAGIPVKTGEPAYSPARHEIFMPSVENFHSNKAYYATAFHEMAHSTMFECGRVKRGQYRTVKGSKEYAFEEVIAELSAAMLCGIAGVSSDGCQHPEYIKGWLKRVGEEQGGYYTAAKLASKAVDTILAYLPEDCEL